MFTDPQEISSRSGLSASGESRAPGKGRWIRPAVDLPASGPGRLASARDLDDLGSRILRDARKRVSGLAQLERELEDRIRVRWEEAEAEARRRLARLEEEGAAARRRAEAEAKEKSLRVEKEGRAVGFREGFSRGRDEGYRLGVEEGRRDGDREGREEASRRLEGELSGAARALSEAAAALRADSERLLKEARDGLFFLAVEIAKKLVKREIRGGGDVAARNVEKAIELIFRRGALVIQVSPEDAAMVERTLKAEPRWAEGFDTIDVRPAADVGRGGCRLISGAGTCDMTLETQLALIEDALLSSAGEPASQAGDAAPTSRPAAAASQTGVAGPTSRPAAAARDGGTA